MMITKRKKFPLIAAGGLLTVLLVGVVTIFLTAQPCTAPRNAISTYLSQLEQQTFGVEIAFAQNGCQTVCAPPKECIGGVCKYPPTAEPTDKPQDKPPKNKTATPVPPPTAPANNPGGGGSGGHGGSGGGDAEDSVSSGANSGTTYRITFGPLRVGDCSMNFDSNNICRLAVARAVYSGLSNVPPPAPVGRFYDLGGPDEGLVEWLYAKGYVDPLVGSRPDGYLAFCPGCPVSRSEAAFWLSEYMRGPGPSTHRLTDVFDDVNAGTVFSGEISELLDKIYEIGLGPPLYWPNAGMVGSKMATLLDLADKVK